MAGANQALLMRGAPAVPEPKTPVFISKGTFTFGTAAISVPPPSAYANGDLLVLLVNSANQAITTPSGWTQFANSPQFTGTAGAAGGVRIAAFYKYASGVEPSVTVADTGSYTAGIMLSFTATASSSPANVTAGSVKSSATGTTFTLPAVTTTLAKDLILLIVGMDRDLTSSTNLSGWTNANLTDLVEVSDDTTGDGAGGGIGSAVGVDLTAGSTGTTTVTSAVATTAAFLTIALKSTTTYFDTVFPIAITGNISDTTYGGAEASCSFAVNTDGTITASGGEVAVQSGWTNKPSTGIGSSYWVKYNGFNSGGWTGDNVDQWLQVSVARSWAVSAISMGFGASAYMLGSFQIATDSAGTNVVSNGFVYLTATSNEGPIP